MEYKIERNSEIENLIEFEEYYGEIIGYSEGLFLARQRYDRKDVDGLKEFFYISEEEARIVLEEDWHTSHVDIYFFVDPINNKILGPYTEAEPFSCGLASVDEGTKVIDKQGNIVMTPEEIHTKYDVQSICSFKNDIAVARIFINYDDWNGHSVFLNTNRKFIHNGRYYDLADDFSDDVAIVCKDKVQYIMDKKGNMRMNPLENTLLARYDEGFSEGLCSIYSFETEKYGFIDKNFNIVIPMEYDGVKSFSCGLCAVRKDDKWGYIDKEGNVKIPFIFDEASSFKNGVAVVNRKVKNRVSEKIESALINIEGKIILDYTGDDIDIYDDVIVVNNLEYVPIKDMKISYSVRINKGYDFVDKSFDSLDEREMYFELASKEIENSNSDYKEKVLAIKKEVYSDLDKKLDELENSSLVKKTCLNK